MQSWEQAVGRGQDRMQRSSRRRRGVGDWSTTGERASERLWRNITWALGNEGGEQTEGLVGIGGGGGVGGVL
jgi:hypothetical protein